MNRIIVTGDIFRVGANVKDINPQRVNIEWLFQLIRPSLQMIVGLPIQPLHYTGGQNCLATKVYRAHGLDRSFATWVSFYQRIPTARDLAMLEAEFCGALVIGFELPEFTRQAMDTLDIPYVDFTIHPVRFMDDLIFGVRSNIVGLAEALQEWVVSEDTIRIQAGLARATLVRLPPVQQCIGVENAALFCGQTTDDKVLIRNGRLMLAEDFLSQINEMCSRHERVFIKPHPYSPNNPVILTLTRLFPNTEVVDANFYHLLVQEGITHVYSITSSTSVEAAYFDKHGRHFASYPYVFTDFTASGGAYLTIDSEIYSPKFWAQIISLLNIPCSRLPLTAVNKVPSRIRRSLRSFWGADIFERS
ncbi:hypothetical protein [Tepidimonas charontis]|uniref:hypothetical protein n=1 Tax=Tepidimonas charontis TaxID=2267262 RepID=UPI001F40BBFF|nr:hypothetical protein [Tepidimonas charontis]